VYPEEGCAGPRDEDATLVDRIIHRVKGAIVLEWRGPEWKEQGWRNALIDGVLSNVYDKKR